MNRRVLLLYQRMIPSVRLCGLCQLEELQARCVIDLRARTTMQVSSADLAWAETVLLCRLDNRYDHRLAQRMKRAGKSLVYIMDDDLLNVPDGLSSTPYYHQKQVQESIRGLIDLSDAILSPSPVLLDKYARDGRGRFWLEEPAIDPVSPASRTPDRPVCIGFAGSVDRAGDIEQLLRDTLLRIHAEYGPRVTFTFFGAVPSFAAALDARCVPYCDSYDAYRRTLNSLQLDIGLAPMPDTPFHSCKHYNKFVEYAAAGTVGVFSDVPPYDRLRTNFGWELLCPNTADAWYATLTRLIEHPEELAQHRARQDALVATAFSIPVIATHLYEDLDTLPRHAPAKVVAPLPLLMMKAAAWCRRAWSALKRYGLKAPALVVRRLRSRLGRA